ncbi:hypothetical protein Hypma_011218 [Hypsizygus marmoreus]|uniref:G-protein coupled receptors family 2 profile 2 domain-containing protein n=1 Tax=Hypsizygus marmoreus TaxID=39966 RepID=A0A369JHL5_HYPMA|nr:hypothetical protein Hypma_011218 [Hypsizygus marmoreus]
MSHSDDDAFEITEAEINFAGVLAFASTIPGTIVCALVLVAYGVVAKSLKARKVLDRVSFRLLVRTLIFNVLFGIAFAATPTSPGRGCDFGAFAINLTLCFATFFTTCIAINLQLVLIHGVNGKIMEKYYIIGTTLLTFALNIPTYALDQFGWNDLSATCWYKNDDDKTRLRWIIATSAFWISLAATIETICSFTVLVWLYRFQRTIETLTKDAQPISFTATGSRSSASFRHSRRVTIGHDPKYRRIILRIALYPIVSLLMNFSTVALDLHMSIVGMHSRLEFRLLVLDLILYGLRTLAYGLLAARDPSFINAIHEIHEIRGSSRQGAPGDAQTLTHLDFATMHSQATTHGESSRLTVDIELHPVASDFSLGKSTAEDTHHVTTTSKADDLVRRPQMTTRPSLEMDPDAMWRLGRQL